MVDVDVVVSRVNARRGRVVRMARSRMGKVEVYMVGLEWSLSL